MICIYVTENRNWQDTNDVQKKEQSAKHHAKREKFDETDVGHQWVQVGNIGYDSYMVLNECLDLWINFLHALLVDISFECFQLALEGFDLHQTEQSSRYEKTGEWDVHAATGKCQNNLNDVQYLVLGWTKIIHPRYEHSVR